MYLLIILHIEHINVLDFDDESDRNWWFFSGNLRIIFIGDSAQLFSAQGEWVIRLGQRSSTGQRRQRLVLEIIAKSERKKTGSVKGSGVTDSLESYQIYRLWLPLDISDNNIMTKRTTHREPSQYKDVILPVYIGVSMLKISLIFNMGIPYLERRYLYSDGPRGGLWRRNKGCVCKFKGFTTLYTFTVVLQRVSPEANVIDY